MKISVKLTIPIILINVILLVTIVYFSNSLINDKFEEDYMRSLKEASNGMVSTLSELKVDAENACLWFKDSARIINALNNNDRSSISDLSSIAREAFGFDLFIIIESNGTLFYSSDDELIYGVEYSDKFAQFNTAANGKSYADVQIWNDMVYINALSPVYNTDGEVMAVLVLGYNLSTEGFVDKYGSLLSQEITIFNYDTRSMTTLTDASGKRLIGTKLTDEKVKDEVLVKHNEYYGKTQIQGNDFICLYTPLKNNNGDTIIIFLGKNLNVVQELASSASKSLGYIIAVITVLSIIAMAVMIYIIIRRPLKKLINKLDEIKKPDSDSCNLTIRIPTKTKDEIGDISRQFNSLLEEIFSIVKNINVVSDTLHTASETLAAASEETSATTMDISNSVSSISDASAVQCSEAESGVHMAEVLSDNLIEIIENAGIMKSSADDTEHITQSGLNYVKLLQETSNQNNAAIKDMSEKVTGLNKKSHEIGSILNVITGITEQINLLSLNASIEAARAGDAGRGFAVVANEVGNLADSSEASTTEIQKLLFDIQDEINSVVSIMEKVTKLIFEQSNVVNSTRESFGNISASVGKIVDNINLVSGSIRSIESSKDDILQSMNSISGSTQTSSESTKQVSYSINEISIAIEDIARLSQSLNDVSQELNSNVKVFIV